MEKDNLIKPAEVTSDQHQASGIAINPPIFQLQVNPTNNTPAQLKKEEEVQEKSIEDFSSLSYDTGDADPPGDKKSLNQLSQAKPPVFQLKSSSSSGMPYETLNKMSSSFGTDFSDVNIHSDSKSATDAGALAYTQGNDIHFAPGQYDPGSQSGQELLGHELTHVQQQREGRVQANNEVNGMPLNDDKGLEAEADEGGRMAVQRAIATDSVPNTEQTIGSNLPIQRTLNADQLNRTLNIIHGQSVVTASRGGAGETTNINQSDAVRVLREQNQNIDQIKTAFDERYHQPLRDYIRFHYTDDYRVRATALLYEPTYLAPWTQIALCLIPQFTRDVNFFNIMSNLTSSQRETLRSKYNEYFSELGNGSLDADIADDFEGQDEMRARILIYRQLTDSDNLYLATAGQDDTDVTTVISILTRKWEEGISSFTHLIDQWNPSDSLPDVVNSGNIATNYFNTLPFGGEHGFNVIGNRGRSFMYTILSELSGAAHSRVQIIFLEYLNQRNHSRGAETAPSGGTFSGEVQTYHSVSLEDLEARERGIDDQTEINNEVHGVANSRGAETAPSGWAFSFEEESRLRVARTDLEAGESGIDDSAEIAAAIGHIIAIYLDRIHRLEAGQASQADIAAAREDMESTRVRLQRDHLDTALGNPDADGNLNLYELNPGDRLWLQRNNLEEYKRIILDYFVRNDLETLKESCRTPHVEYGVRTAHQIAIDNVLWERAESNSTVRAGFRLGEQTDLSNNDVYYSHFCQVGPVTARHGKGLLEDYLVEVSYASLATISDFLLHPRWDQALLNNILELFPNSGDPTLSAKQNFVLHLRSLHFDDLPNFPRIRDVFDPPHSAADRLARARRDAAHDEATAGILGNVATSISDAVTGEDTRDTLGASIDRLQIFTQQSNTSDEMCQLFRDFYGPTLDLSNMEYGVFQQNLQALQNGRSAVAEAVSAVVSTAIEAILTPFISPVGAALIGQICGILMNEMMDAQHTEVFSTESLRQTVLGAASAGAGVVLEDGSVVARLINDFSGNSAVRGLIREGVQSSISSAATLLTDGLRGQLTEEAILAELQTAIASAVAGGLIGHDINAPENRQFINQLREEAIQNVTASLAQQQAGILVNLATTGQIDDNYLDQTAQTIAVGLRDGLITAASTHSSEAVRVSYRASRERSRTRREAASATHPSTADVAGTDSSARILPPPIVVGTDQPSVSVLPPPISIGSPTHPSDSQPSERPERAPILPPPSDQSLEPVIIPPQGRVPVIDDSSDNSLTTPESESETRITGEWERPTDRSTEIGAEQSRDTLIDDIHPSAEEGSEVQVGSDQSAARAPQSTAGTSAASVPVIPYCHVSLLSKSSRMTDVEYQIFVRQEFNSRILQDPSREVGLYENLLTGEWIIIQGDHASVNLPRPGTSVFDSQSDVANIIDESALGSNWRSAYHSHPSAGGEGVSPVNRYPSSSDVGIQIVACARNNNQPQHSEIRYLDGNGNIQRTEFGVDLSRSNPILIAYTDPATGAVIHDDFPDLTAYHFYMDHTFSTSMGAPDPHLEEFLHRRPEPIILSGAAFDGQDNFDGLGSGDLRADRQIGDEVGRMDGLTPTRDSSREDTLIVPRAPHHDASDDSLDSTIDETEPEVRILPPPIPIGSPPIIREPSLVSHSDSSVSPLDSLFSDVPISAEGQIPLDPSDFSDEQTIIDGAIAREPTVIDGSIADEQSQVDERIARDNEVDEVFRRALAQLPANPVTPPISHLSDRRSGVDSVREHGDLSCSLTSNLGDRLGSAGYDGSGVGVYTGEINTQNGIRSVAIKLYENTSAGRSRMEQELNGARSAAQTGYGSVVYGEIQITDPNHINKIGFAMDLVSGGFANSGETDSMSPQEQAAAEAEANSNAMNISQNTIDDLMDFSNSILAQNYYYFGEVQGFVDSNGNYNPLDFETLRPLSSDPEIRNGQIFVHNRNVSGERVFLETEITNQVRILPPTLSVDTTSPPVPVLPPPIPIGSPPIIREPSLVSQSGSGVSPLDSLFSDVPISAEGQTPLDPSDFSDEQTIIDGAIAGEQTIDDGGNLSDQTLDDGGFPNDTTEPSLSLPQNPADAAVSSAESARPNGLDQTLDGGLVSGSPRVEDPTHVAGSTTEDGFRPPDAVTNTAEVDALFRALLESHQSNPTNLPVASSTPVSDRRAGVSPIREYSNCALVGGLGDRVGSAGHEGSGIGVYHGEISTPNGLQSVVIKLYNNDDESRSQMEDELNGARAAAHTGYGSVVYGEIPISDPRHQNMIGFAMGVASGGFVEAHIENMTPQQEADANNEADLNSSYVSQRTIDDLNDFANALLAQNYYYAGEVQGFVDRNGNYNPIDLQGISPLSSDSSTRAEQVIEHQLNFRAEQELLTSYLERNLQNQANNVPPPISSNSSNNPNDPNTQS